MYRKISIKILTAIFFVLLVIVILLEYFNARQGNRTFKSDLVEVDPAAITTIEIFARSAGGNMISLFKENDLWFVESEGEKYQADQAAAGQMISQLNRIQPESVVATRPEKWEQFEVTDSLGTRLKIYTGEKLLADLVIGKFSFSPPRKMTSYVRLADENEVYGVEGMLGMTFNRNLNSFRDRTIISSSANDWKKLTFTYPADSSFTLEKMAEGWMIGGIPADSAQVKQYFSAISSLSDGNFADRKPPVNYTHLLVIEGNNGMQPVEISGYFQDDGNYFLESNQNKGTWFNTPETAKKLFVNMESFFKPE